MDTNKMRLGLIYILSENKKISKQSKLQLIKFIENANIYQLKALAIDGEIISSTKLNEQTKNIINDRFTVSEVEVLLNKAALGAVKHLTKVNEGAVTGALKGAVLGGLMGLLTPVPMTSFAGAAGGAITGAVVGWRNTARRAMKKRMEDSKKALAAKKKVAKK